MKILAVSDVHGDKELIKSLAKQAQKKNVDLVILAGDLTFWEQDLEGIIGPFKEVNKKVVVIPGNHETVATTDFLAKLYQPGTYNLHGYSMKMNSLGLLGFGGASIGMFRVEDDQLLDTLTRVDKELKDTKKKLMIVHMPPKDTKLDFMGRSSVGSDGVRKAIELLQPDICICGHIHETGGLEDKIGKTRVINVSTPKGVIIDI